MAEQQFNIAVNGQEVQQADFNMLGASSGLADDRTLADILRMVPFTGTVQKAVLPYGYPGSTAATVAPTGSANGSVTINPFRAIIGPRTAAATNALLAWRDIRSGVFVGGGGSWSAAPPTALTFTQAFGANGSGQPRWDLVYAVVSVDAFGSNVTRYVKPPGTTVSTPTPVTNVIQSAVSIGVVPGMPGASPALPAITADGSGNYYIPLAYVRIPIAFGAGNTIATADIYDVAPVPIGVPRGTGGAGLSVANQQNAVGGAVVPGAKAATWGAGTTNHDRPPAYMPATMCGLEVLQVSIDLRGVTPGNWSHGLGTAAIIDNSRDWSKRNFLTVAMAVQDGGVTHFAWDKTIAGVVAQVPSFARNSTVYTDALGVSYGIQMGQSYTFDGPSLPVSPGASTSVVCFFTQSQISQLASASPQGFGLYVNGANANRLELYVNGTGLNSVINMWVFATGPYGNY